MLHNCRRVGNIFLLQPRPDRTRFRGYHRVSSNRKVCERRESMSNRTTEISHTDSRSVTHNAAVSVACCSEAIKLPKRVTFAIIDVQSASKQFDGTAPNKEEKVRAWKIHQLSDDQVVDFQRRRIASLDHLYTAATTLGQACHRSAQHSENRIVSSSYLSRIPARRPASGPSRTAMWHSSIVRCRECCRSSTNTVSSRRCARAWG